MTFTRIFSGLIVVFTMSALAGCGGPSTQELMMRAAQRARPKDGDADDDDKAPKKVDTAKADGTDKAGPTAPTPPGSQTAGSAKKTTGQSLTAAEPKTDVTPTEVLETLDQLSLKPIAERGLTAAGKEAGRQKSVDNLVKISEALEKYHAEHNRFPPRYVKSKGGLPTLSWRVTLLPYLGYQDLYDKFDFGRPWNFEPNKSLLNYMPPEYMSPERNDTSTNYLLPAFRTFMFGAEFGRRKHDVAKEDGVENTILLLELDDELAVPWTKPVDYIPTDIANVKNDMGQLRGDGTFAVWANGWTVFLANQLSNEQIVNALTFDAGDGQLAGSIHRDIPVSVGSDPSTVVVKKTKDKPTMAPSHRPSGRTPRPIEPVKVREKLPIAGDIAKAQNKLRKIFVTRIAEAKEDEDKNKLADEMVSSAQAMQDDPAGAYALQSAAISLAVTAGEVKTVLSATDQRVGRFEVDSYEENMKSLLAFAQGSSRREPDEVDGEAFFRRAIPVIFAGIEDNDFVRASSLARHCYRLRDQEPDEELMKSLNRLRVLLGSAQREFTKASENLSRFRDDPTDVDAGAAFGRFLCFIKGDWSVGLPLVEKGGDKRLRAVAQMDLTGAKTYQEEIAIGDAWWDLAEPMRNGVYRQALHDRAVFWYRSAWESIPDSLDRLHVKNRLDEMEDQTGASPLALIQAMAEDVGVDLTVSLGSIADVGQRRGRIAANEDDDDD